MWVSLAVVGWSTMSINLPSWKVLESVAPQTFFSVAILAPAAHAAATQGCLWQSLHCLLCSVWRGGRSMGEGSNEPEWASPADTDSTAWRNVCVTTTQGAGWISLCGSLWLNRSGSSRLLWKRYPLLAGAGCLKEKAKGHFVYSFKRIVSCIKEITSAAAVSWKMWTFSASFWWP